MYRTKTGVMLLAMAMGAGAKDFDGKQALEFTRRAVEFGPRPPGSAGIHKLQAYILAQLKLRRCEVIQDDFTAQTPNGPVMMKNIIARFPGRSGRAVVLTGHYDTKLMPGFVGANDGGSSTGFLLAMAAAMDGTQYKDDRYLVWFDGEEAIKDWSATDSLYGSRHLAGKWAAEGLVGKIKALINVDMIGDADLGILRDGNSATGLTNVIWNAAQTTGYGKYFTKQQSSTEDDHIPFVRLGVQAVDLIDFTYPPWHTPQDTMDKLSAHSFQVVGEVLSTVLSQLEGMK
jgi:glutaminyl-peptide cyclotransferase